MGASVTLCSGLADIRARSKEQPPDAIVADFWGTSHLALSEEERRQIAALGQLAPLVLVSARRWAQDAEPADLGLAGLVPKPLEIDDFLDVLRQAIATSEHAESLPPREALSVFFLAGP
jgi:DNA-binding NtrC family response regulator